MTTEQPLDAGGIQGPDAADQGSRAASVSQVGGSIGAPIAFWHVDIRPSRLVVQAVVTHPDGTRHEVGHLPSEGWFCSCRRGKRCALIAAVAELVPAIGGG